MTKRWLIRFFSSGVGLPAPACQSVELRLPVSLFEKARLHVEDFRRGEEAGYLVCAPARHPGCVTLLGREWHPVPAVAIRRDGLGGYASAWQPAFNSALLKRALELRGSLVLVHSHGSDPLPRLSPPDLHSAAEFFPAAARVLGHAAGSIVLGDQAATGRFWNIDGSVLELSRIVVVGAPLQVWTRGRELAGDPRRRLGRQTRAIGPESDARLAASSVAVIGVSGGGSHVCQQLAYQGVGRIIPIDGELVEEVNLGRMIGAGAGDVGVLKTTVMERLVRSIDPTITVDAVPERFPSPRSLAELKSADVVVACVDRFEVREQINAFCRRHHLPLVDIGINIETGTEQLRTAYGQVITVMPDSPCLRCSPLLSDAVLEKERRERPLGYDRNPDALGDPQVVSMNGTLSSEAANNVLDVLTGYAAGARGAAWWLYDGKVGDLQRSDLPPRRLGCPACAEQGLGDTH